MMNISPTPWTLGTFNSIRDAEQNVIAFFAGDKLEPQRLADNTRLTLAAPKMLAMLQKAIGDCQLIVAGLVASPDDFAAALLASEIKRMEAEIRSVVREVES